MANALKGIDSWLYHLGGINSAREKEIGASKAEMVITEFADYSNGERQYTASDINTMRGANDKLVISYLSIGEAEDYRYYWQNSWNAKRPSFLDTENPEWEGNYEVKYWDPAWQKIILGYVNKIVQAGFNGIYMDIVGAYEYWEAKSPGSGINYRQEMANFVASIRKAAETALAKTDPGRKFAIIGQNGEELLLNKTYLKAIDGIASEDIRFYYENGNESGFIKVSTEDYQYRLDLLKQAEAVGKEAFVVEYLTDKRQSQFTSDLQKEIAELKKDGIPLYVAKARDLDNLYNQPSSGNNNEDAPKQYGGSGHDKLKGTDNADYMDGKGGNDTLQGGKGNDTLLGNAGEDTLQGGKGNDALNGGKGNDRLAGEGGKDTLTGGAGKDSFVFEGNWGKDTIQDFAIGQDKLKVTSPVSFDAQVENGHIILVWENEASITLTTISESEWLAHPDSFFS